MNRFWFSGRKLLTTGGGGGVTDPGDGGGFDTELPFLGRFYGYMGDGAGVGNTKMRKVASEGGTSNFFFADFTGVISHFRYQKRYGGPSANTNYSSDANNLGTYTVAIVKADPATKRPLIPLQYVSWIDNYQPPTHSSTSSGQAFHTVEFTNKGAVTALEPYCLTWVNTGSTSFYFSMNTDMLVSWDGANNTVPTSPPYNVGWPSEGSEFFCPFTLSMADGIERPVYPYPITWDGPNNIQYDRVGPPLMEYGYQDANAPNGIQWSGWGAWGSPYNAGYLSSITSTTHLRERFRVSRKTRVVTGIWLKIMRLDAAGDLVVTLESGPTSSSSGNGTTIESVTVPAANVPTVGSDYSRYQDIYPWTYVQFGSNRSLSFRQIYSLRLSVSGSGTYQMVTGARAEQQGFSPVNTDFEEHEATRQVSWLTFEDSVGAQLTTDSGTSWSYSLGAGSRRQMPIVFAVEPSSGLTFDNTAITFDSTTTTWDGFQGATAGDDARYPDLGDNTQYDITTSGELTTALSIATEGDHIVFKNDISIGDITIPDGVIFRSDENQARTLDGGPIRPGNDSVVWGLRLDQANMVVNGSDVRIYRTLFVGSFLNMENSPRAEVRRCEWTGNPSRALMVEPRNGALNMYFADCLFRDNLIGASSTPTCWQLGQGVGDFGNEPDFILPTNNVFERCMITRWSLETVNESELVTVKSNFNTFIDCVFSARRGTSQMWMNCRFGTDNTFQRCVADDISGFSARSARQKYIGCIAQNGAVFRIMAGDSAPTGFSTDDPMGPYNPDGTKNHAYGLDVKYTLCNGSLIDSNFSGQTLPPLNTDVEEHTGKVTFDFPGHTWGTSAASETVGTYNTPTEADVGVLSGL